MKNNWFNIIRNKKLLVIIFQKNKVNIYKIYFKKK